MQSRWTRVLKVLDEGVDFKRRIVESLRPTLLDNMGLLPAVRWITEETCRRAGLQFTESYPDREPQLADDASIMVFRLVQEALTNIVKHAQATQVSLQLSLTESELVVVIADDGIGIAGDRRDAVGSHGIATMRHRVRSFGGHLDIEPVSPHGTRVRARLPLSLILRADAPGPLPLASPQAPAPQPALPQSASGT